MPKYTFRNKVTEEEKEEWMTISEMSKFTKENPEWVCLITPLQSALRDNFVASRHTNLPIDSDFRNMLQNMKSSNPGSNIDY